MPRLPSLFARAAAASLTGLVLMSASARADDLIPAPAPSTPVTENPSPAPPSAGAPTRERCLCSPERLVKLAKEMAPGDPLAVVLDEGEHSLVDTFAADFFARGASSEDDAHAAVALEPFVYEGLTASKRRLYRVSLAPSATTPFFVGLRRKKESVPKDVVKVTDGVESHIAPPATLSSLFVGPDENRAPRGCGPSRTRALSFSTLPGALPLAGFLVDLSRTDGTVTHTFVDERHARSFGLGRVEPCDHGALLDESVASLAVRPVGVDLAVGDAWSFDTATRVPTLKNAPPGRDEAIENPFTRDLPGQESTFDDESDKAALGTMLGLVGAAGVLASMLWPVLRRRRAIVKVSCPACGTGLTLDLRDPSVDGGFCPSCGKASIFVSHRADGAPEARLFILDGRKDE
jgi:hypothetical protein